MVVTMTALTLGVSVIIAWRSTGAAVGSQTGMLLGEVGIRCSTVLLPFVAGYFFSYFVGAGRAAVLPVHGQVRCAENEVADGALGSSPWAIGNWYPC